MTGKKIYGIYRDGKLLKHTQCVHKFCCWYYFCKEHLKAGGTFKNWRVFVMEAKQLGYEVRKVETSIEEQHERFMTLSVCDYIPKADNDR